MNKGSESLSEWFELSYANYLTIPRSVLQSMPDAWQGHLAALLCEMDDECARHGLTWPGDGQSVSVVIRNSDGTFAQDSLSDYARGRRRLWNAAGNENNRRDMFARTESKFGSALRRLAGK